MIDSILPIFGPILESLAGKYGVLAQILMIMGLARLCMKPLMTSLGEIVKITPSEKDDAFLNKVLASQWYKGICFVLDFVLSIKLPKAPK